MKCFVKWLLPIFVFIFPAAATAQDFAPLGAKWHYTFSDEYWPVNFPVYNYRVTTVEATHDTTVDGLNVRVLKVTNNDTCNALRNRLLVYEQAGKVFVKDELRPGFYLLYDFDAEKSESWKISGYPELGDSLEILVDSVAHVVYGHDTLKEMFVSISTDGVYDTPENLFSTIKLNENKIVERMGHLFNLFPWWGGLCHKPRAIKLRCYSHGTFTWHAAPEYENNCDTVYSHNTSTQIAPVAAFTAYPNPARNFLFVNFFEESREKTVVISDMAGKAHKKIKCLGKSVQIDLTGLPAGLYFMHIITQEKTSQTIFMKM